MQSLELNWIFSVRLELVFMFSRQRNSFRRKWTYRNEKFENRRYDIFLKSWNFKAI